MDSDAWIPWTGTVLAERELSYDQRAFAPDSVTWPGAGPLPMHDGNGDICGSVERLWRAYSHIRASGRCDPRAKQQGFALGAAVKLVSYQISEVSEVVDALGAWRFSPEAEQRAVDDDKIVLVVTEAILLGVAVTWSKPVFRSVGFDR